VLVAAPQAAAAPTCAFDDPTATVTVAVGEGETATISRMADAIALDGVPCGAATVANTDAIVVNATGIPVAVVIDLSGGEFGPGLTTETEGGAEIEFTINLPAGSPVVRIMGGPQSDTIVVGSAGINLNAAESLGDADVTLVGQPTVVVDGAGGSDALSVDGGGGTGEPSMADLAGGAGDDALSGGIGGSSFDGGDGIDTLDYAGTSGPVDADLASGVVQHDGGESDQVVAVENLTGSPADDTIVGTDEANVLEGLAGSDLLVAAGGDDTIDGGAGADTADLSLADAAVEVDLSKGTATGAGTDTLINVENAVGTDKADTLIAGVGHNTLDGAGGSDSLSGGDGGDVLSGGDGRDLLFGEKGHDELTGGSGNDQLDGGKAKKDVCRGGSGADSFVDCETVKVN
jgi:Ca2+-binding RTX toxin-like protein